MSMFICSYLFVTNTFLIVLIVSFREAFKKKKLTNVNFQAILSHFRHTFLLF